MNAAHLKEAAWRAEELGVDILVVSQGLYVRAVRDGRGVAKLIPYNELAHEVPNLTLLAVEEAAKVLAT